MRPPLGWQIYVVPFHTSRLKPSSVLSYQLEWTELRPSGSVCTMYYIILYQTLQTVCKLQKHSHACLAVHRYLKMAATSVTDAQLLYDCHCQLGESPTWDERVQRLYFVDINAHKLHIYNPETKDDDVIEAPLMVSTVMPTADPNILVVTLHR